MRQPRQRSPLYLLQAFGFSEWNVWALHEGGLSEWCATCRGTGKYRGVRCWRCKGSRLTPPEPVLAEDFGDKASRDAAQAMFPGLVIRYDKRSDMHARAM